MVLLKYVNNFWKNYEVPLINYGINFILTWSANCVISNAPANQAETIAIADTIFYVSVVTLSTKDNANLFEQLKSGFKRKNNWNKYQPKVSAEILRYLN